MHLFEGTTADEVWLMAASKFEDANAVREQSSRAGLTRELLGAVFTIKNPRQRWITSRQPAINPAFAIAEVVWIVSGRRDAAFFPSRMRTPISHGAMTIQNFHESNIRESHARNWSFKFLGLKAGDCRCGDVRPMANAAPRLGV